MEKEKLSREEKINALIGEDIDMIRKGLYNEDVEYLTNILLGNGWKQYNFMSDEEIDIEYKELEKKNG